MTRWRTLQAAALALSLVAMATPGNAAPFSAATAPQATQTEVTPVQYRGYGYVRGPSAYRAGYRPYRSNYGYRPFIGFGIGAAVVAGAIIASRNYAPRRGYYYDTYAYDGPYYYPSDYRGDPRDICARHFRSFEWRTGLYTTYQGEKRVCPYLGT